jgi:Protein of unknown function (DUF4079)
MYAAYLGFFTRWNRVKHGAGELLRLVPDGSRGEGTGRKHYKLAGVLLCATVAGTYLGMANAFTRTGRLFPGPHLYLGLGES